MSSNPNFRFTNVFNRWADNLDSLSAAATQDPDGFLGHPVNAFKLMKRLNTEWRDLESLVLSDTTDGMNKKKGFKILIWHVAAVLFIHALCNGNQVS